MFPLRQDFTTVSLLKLDVLFSLELGTVYNKNSMKLFLIFYILIYIELDLYEHFYEIYYKHIKRTFSGGLRIECIMIERVDLLFIRRLRSYINPR